MITITAVIKVKSGDEGQMEKGLLDVAASVRANEPGTISFYVSRKLEDPTVFTTYERFVDRAAMDAHNNSATVAAFFELAQPILDGPVILETCEELWAK